MTWLDREVYDNALGLWLAVAGAGAVAWLLLRGARAVLAIRRGRSEARTSGDELAASLLARTHDVLVVMIAIGTAGLVLSLPSGPGRGLRLVVAIAGILQLGLWGSALIAFAATQHARRRLEQDPATVTTVSVLSFMAQVLLWSLLLLAALDNMGVDITALVAGLGIGGIAVALAMQNVLGDVFAAFAIALDRPFSIGDFIVVDELMGTVEHIGLKTTRIRSISGEQVAIGNSNLLADRIRNYKRMTERRVTFTIGVTYETPAQTLAGIPETLREIVEARPTVRFDRAHFKAYGDFALIFEVVYYVLSPHFRVYMDVQQEINFDIYRRFDEAGIEFAYPTQTLHLRRATAPALQPAGGR